MAASDEGRQEYFPPSEGRTDSIVSTEEYCPTAEAYDFPSLDRDLDVDWDPESCQGMLKVKRALWLCSTNKVWSGNLWKYFVTCF